MSDLPPIAASDESQQHVVQACRDHDVKFTRLWFTDILGMLKSVAITIEELEHAFADGVSFGQGADGGRLARCCARRAGGRP